MRSYCNTEEGNVFVWGYGILGKGPNLVETAVPEMIPPSLFGWSDFSPDIRVAHVRCGLSQFAALTSKFLILLSWRSYGAVLLAEKKKSKKSLPNQKPKPKQEKTPPQKVHSSFLKLKAHWNAAAGSQTHLQVSAWFLACFVLTCASVKKVLFV